MDKTYKNKTSMPKQGLGSLKREMDGFPDPKVIHSRRPHPRHHILVPDPGPPLKLLEVLVGNTVSFLFDWWRSRFRSLGLDLMGVFFFLATGHRPELFGHSSRYVTISTIYYLFPSKSQLIWLGKLDISQPYR